MAELPDQIIHVDILTRLANIIAVNEGEIRRAWESEIREFSPTRAACMIDNIAHETQAGRDLLAILRDQLSDGSSLAGAHIDRFVQQVHRANWSLSDFHATTESLILAFESVLERQTPTARVDWIPVIRKVRQCLSRTFAAVLQRTAGIQEQIVETGQLPICELSTNGEITYVNPAMARLLEIEGSNPRRLQDYLNEDASAFVMQAISADGAQGTNGREVRLKQRGGGSKPLWLTIQPLIVGTSRVGAFATATDISTLIAREEKFLDRLLLPAIKLDQDYAIIYANPATATLLGDAVSIVGRSVYDVFPATAKQSDQFKKRRQGQADLYETEIVRRSDGKKIPVSVAGTPILDDAGNFMGSLGIVRSLELERITQAIHDAIDTESDEQTLLTKVAESVRQLVPFDYFMVTQYSSKAERVSRWFDYAVDGRKIEITRRWWPVAGSKAEIEKPANVPDFQAFIHANRPDLVMDADVCRCIEHGFQSMLRVPVRRGNEVVASLVLFSKASNQYSESDLQLLLTALPLPQAVQMAAYYKGQKDFECRYELCRQMVRLGTARELADLLARTFARHYGWTHVSVSKVCKAEHIFTRLAETASVVEPVNRLISDRQPLNSGIPGYAYELGSPVNVPDVDAPEWRERFLAVWPGIRSELCIPIVWDGEIQWMLDIEDERVDAFSAEEQEQVVSILDEVEAILAGMSERYLLTSAFASSSDAFLITDTQSNVLRANPAAVNLLGYQKVDELKGPFGRLFLDPGAAEKVFRHTDPRPVDVDLRAASGDPIPVLMSGSDLPEDLFRKIFVAKDLRSILRLKKLEDLRRLFQDIGIQTHLPLALINTWLKRAAAEHPDEDLYPKVLAQLKKLEITYDRLALCADSGPAVDATRPESLDIGVEFKRLLDGFPESERQIIDFDDPGELPYIQADQVQVTFIFASIVSYLSRGCGGVGGCIRVRIERSPTRQTVIFSSLQSPQFGERQLDPVLARTRFDLALGEPTIRAFAEKNSGRYIPPVQNEAGTTIQIYFEVPEA